MGFSIFISYATRDLERATQMKQVLDATGSEVYLAEYSAPPGVALATHIAAAIKTCDLFVLLWSTYTRSSEWVPQEIGIAKAHGKQILPVVLEPGLELPGFIRDLKYLPHYKNPKAAVEWLRKNVFERAHKKQQTDGLVWLGLGAAILMALNQGPNRGGT